MTLPMPMIEFWGHVRVLGSVLGVRPSIWVTVQVYSDYPNRRGGKINGGVQWFCLLQTEINKRGVQINGGSKLTVCDI